MDSCMAKEEGVPKITGIRQIVRLREILRKWRSIALDLKDSNMTSITTLEIEGKEVDHVDELKGEEEKEILSSDQSDDSYEDDSDRDEIEDEEEEEDDDDDDSQLPADVPKGHLAVYVGAEHRRFVIPTLYLDMPPFKVLLQKAEEEFGFEHQGALTFPCEVETFKYILMSMQRHKSSVPA